MLITGTRGFILKQKNKTIRDTLIESFENVAFCIVNINRDDNTLNMKKYN